jgi:hypothetical protein
VNLPYFGLCVKFRICFSWLSSTDSDLPFDQSYAFQIKFRTMVLALLAGLRTIGLRSLVYHVVSKFHGNFRDWMLINQEKTRLAVGRVLHASCYVTMMGPNCTLGLGLYTP